MQTELQNKMKQFIEELSAHYFPPVETAVGMCTPVGEVMQFRDDAIALLAEIEAAESKTEDVTEVSTLDFPVMFKHRDYK